MRPGFLAEVGALLSGERRGARIASMGHVLNAILSLDGDAHGWEGPRRDARIAEIDAWIVERSYPNPPPMRQIDPAFGGASAAEVTLFAFASARVSLTEFAEYLRSLPWVAGVPNRSMGDIVQLLVKCEHDWGWRIVHVYGEVRVECCEVPAIESAPV